MKTVDKRSISVRVLRRFMTDPGPRSKIIVSSISIEGHARLALRDDPPDPRNWSFK